MFDPASLFWTLWVLLKYSLFLLIIVPVIILGIAYLIGHSRSSSTSVRVFPPKKVIYAIVGSQSAMLFISAVYIAYHLQWSLMPDALITIKFFTTPRHYGWLILLTTVGNVISVLILKIVSPLTWGNLGFRKPSIGLPLIIASVILGLLVSIVTNITWKYLTGIPQSSNILVELTSSLKLYFHIYYVVWVVLIAPVVEEMFFRGVLFASLKETVGFRLGLVLQAVVFSVSHAQVNELFPLFILGCILGYVYYRSSSLMPSIIVHVLNNGLSLL